MAGRIFTLLVILFSTTAYGIGYYDFSIWNTNPRQCHGDADGLGSGIVTKWVNITDLSILQATWNGSWPTYYPDMYYDSRADFDRNFRNDEGDEAILGEWYDKIGVPADCGKKLELVFDKPYVLGGSTQAVTWNWNIFTDYIPLPPNQDSPCSFSFSLYYEYPGSGWIFIGSSTCTGPIQWQVPDVDMQGCRLRIVASNLTGLEDISSYFTIAQCQLDPEMDSDGDCVITMVDYSHLAARWMIEPDGKTIDDLAALASFWLACGDPYNPECVTIGE